MHFKKAAGILSGDTMNIYRGCTHGCVYCDSRSLCYRMNHDFEDVEVKQNAPELLDEALRRRRGPVVVSTGSMSDPYLHAESRLRLTRRCLEVIHRRGAGLSLLTKSERVLEDLELLRLIGERGGVTVAMTLTTADDALCAEIEPAASPASRRFAALLRLREAGIPTVVWFYPQNPYITDTPGNYRGVLRLCREAGVSAIVYFGAGMTLRAGNREHYYRALDRLRPGLSDIYRARYGDAYFVVSPMAEELDAIAYGFCREHGILCGTDEVFSFLKTPRGAAEQIVMDF